MASSERPGILENLAGGPDRAWMTVPRIVLTAQRPP